MSNSVISAITQLTSGYVSPNLSNVIVIDTEQNRIGIKTQTPNYELDINSGNIKVQNMILGGALNEITAGDNYIKIDKLKVIDCSITNINNDISFTSSQIIFKKDINATKMTCFELSVNRLTVDASLIVTDISVINRLYVRNISSIYIDASYLDVRRSSSYQATANYITLTSDDRLKHNETDIINALSTLELLEPKKYQKTQSFLEKDYMGALNIPYRIESGFIAQDVEKIPELKYTVIPGEPYNLNYNDIFVYGIAGIKELNNKLDLCLNIVANQLYILKEKIEELNNKQNTILELENKIQAINSLTNIEEIENSVQRLLSKLNILSLRVERLEQTHN